MVMKIKVVETGTNRTLASTQVQLQVKGKDSGFLSLTTGTDGCLTLEDKLKGQLITITGAGEQAKWITATDGATLLIPTKQKSKETHSTK